MPDYKNFLSVAAHMDAKTWEMIVFVGIPGSLLDIALFYFAFRKLRFYRRTRYPLDGLSGLAVFLMASSSLLTVLTAPLHELFPNVDFLPPIIRFALLGSLYGGMFLYVVLRPYTRFGRSRTVAQEEKEVEKAETRNTFSV